MNRIRHAPILVAFFALVAGPVHAAAAYASLTIHHYEKGDGEYWIFEPAQPTPTTAPVVIFMHGWSAMDPSAYGAWIEHLVLNGNIVIYPRFQGGFRTPTKDFFQNSLGAITKAFATLNEEAGHVKPDLSQVVLMGHSVGSMVAIDLAASPGSLPKPKALLAVEPGISWSKGKGKNPYHFVNDLAKIPSDTKIIAVIGDRDVVVKDIDAKRLMNETPQVPAANKRLFLFRSDFHSKPPLLADHFFPTGPCTTGLIPKPKADLGHLEHRPLLQHIVRRQMKKMSDTDTTDTGMTADELTTASQEGMGSVNAFDEGIWTLGDTLTAGAPIDAVPALGNWPDGQAIVAPQTVQ